MIKCGFMPRTASRHHVLLTFVLVSLCTVKTKNGNNTGNGAKEFVGLYVIN